MLCKIEPKGGIIVIENGHATKKSKKMRRVCRDVSIKNCDGSGADEKRKREKLRSQR